MDTEAKRLLKNMPYLKGNSRADIQLSPDGIPYNAAIPVHNRKMQIVVPTHLRPTRQVTLKSLRFDSVHKETLIITSFEDDAKEIRKNYRELFDHPKEHVISIESLSSKSAAIVDNISKKRQWIIENVGSSSIFQIDDDCYIFARCPLKYRELKLPGPQWILKPKYKDATYLNSPLKLLGTANLTPGMMTETFRQFQSRLTAKEKWFAHVGLSSRMGNNQEDMEWKLNGRIMHAFGHRREVLLRENIRFDEVLLREDMNVTLRLLTRGYPNEVFYGVCCSPGDYGAKGGCMDERTRELSDREAMKLKSLYPEGLVKVVYKEYEYSEPRKEVLVYWNKAYQYGLNFKQEQSKRSLF